MAVRSYPDIDSAVEQLAKTAMVWEDRRALTKQSDAMNIQSIAQWVKDYPLLAGPLLGAGGGGLYGLLTSFGREKEDRSPLQSAMTGALGGGLLGLGGGAAYKYGPEFYNRMRQYFGDKVPTPEVSVAEIPGGADALSKLRSGELKIQDLYKTNPEQAIAIARSEEGKALASPDRRFSSLISDLIAAPGDFWRGLTGGSAVEPPPFEVPEGAGGVSPAEREVLEGIQRKQFEQLNAPESYLPPGTETSAVVGGGLLGTMAGKKVIDRLRNPAWADLQSAAAMQGGQGPNAAVMQSIAESPSVAKSMVRQSRRSQRPDKPARPPRPPRPAPTSVDIRRMLTGEGAHAEIQRPWVPPRPERPARPVTPLHTATIPGGGPPIEAVQVKRKIQEGRQNRLSQKKPSRFGFKSKVGLGGLLTSIPIIWESFQSGRAKRLQGQKTP